MSERIINSIKLPAATVQARQEYAEARSRMTASDRMEEILAERKARHDLLADQAFDRFMDRLGRVFNPTRWFRK